MKPATISRFGHRAAWALGAALFFAHTAVQACPGCKQNTVAGTDGSVPPLNGTSVGFGLSIFFMIAMIVSLLGGLGFMMYRSCQTLAAQQRALLESEEMGTADGSPVRA